MLALGACGKAPAPGAKAQAYCHDLIQEACVRAFECVPPNDRTADFTGTYGTSVEQCQAKPDRCAQYYDSCRSFDPDAGATCLSDFTNMTCVEILILQNGAPTIALPTSCGGAVCP